MADCDLEDCEGDALLSYTCNECGGSYCTDHRLPEEHDCAELRITNFDSDNQRFATGLQDKPGKKRGMTKRDDTTDDSSSPPKSSRSPESEGDSDKPYDTNRGWRSRQRESEVENSDTSSSSEPEAMDLDESQTVGTARDRGGRPSPDVDVDGSLQRGEKTPVAEGSETETGPVGKIQLWGVGLLTTASEAVSDRVRRFAAWLWHVITGVLRLAGAALTLTGIGWTAVSVYPELSAGQYQQAIPAARPVIVLLAGILLVQATKE